MQQDIYVTTLLSRVWPQSIGIKTSIFGRLAFVLAATFLMLWRLRSSPTDFVTPLVLFATEIIAIAVIASPSFLATKCIPLVLLSCVMIGVISRIWETNAPASVAWVHGAARGATWAALSVASLLVATVTRPSDVARLVGRIGVPWLVFLIFAIPLSAISGLATRYRDILFVARSERADLRHGYMVQVAMRIACGLFAVGIYQAMYVYQVALACKPSSGRLKTMRCGRFDAPFIATADLCFLAVLFPVVVTVLISPKGL
jgi:hypothetical protein